MTVPDPDGGPGKRDPDGGSGERDPDGGSGKRTYAPDFLTELFRNPLDPGYADAAARRERTGGRSGTRKRVAGASSAVVLLLIGFLLVVAYRQTMEEEPARTQARQELVEQVERRREETERLQARADKLSGEVAELRERELGETAVAQLRDLAAAAGLETVRGNGAKITVADGPTSIDAVTGERRTDGQVKDTDLQLAANALWSLGAEAIAINGERLTVTSTIRQAGEAILVGVRPVTTPYEVVAIGPAKLADEFRGGYAGQFFDTLSDRYGMSFDVAEVKNVTLDAAAELKLRAAEPSVAPPAPSGSSSPAGSLSPVPSGSASEGGR
ncbi:DUF881 domain-containing protein [Actinoplanes sp. NPDC051861]|uniref:DUF881 domain-containing protein n=1 Tax=Actinoplanes sp. NPDC051861 TaxID=3155170 RepID=UPI0034165A6B